jgi:hypothetical protein
MNLVLPTQADNYFRVAKTSKHAKFCPYDEHGPNNISHIDPEGEPNVAEKLLWSLTETEPRREPPIRKKAAGEIPGGESESDDDDEEIRKIKLTERQVRTLGELYRKLASLPIDSCYGGVEVNKLLIDKRNECEYREKGLEDEQICIVICGKANISALPSYIQMNEERIVIGLSSDFENNSKKKIFFVLEVDEKPRRKILGALKDGKKVAIFAQWKPVGSEINSKGYIAKGKINNK